MHDRSPDHAHPQHAPSIENAAVASEGSHDSFAGGGHIPAVGGGFHDPPASASDRAFGHHDTQHHAPDTGEIHIITEGGLRHLRHAGPAGRHAAKVLYDNPHAYVVLKPGQHMPHGWKGHATLLYPSYTAFAAAMHAGQIGSEISAVVYDNEHWQQTPLYEKQDPAKYARMFEELAHSHGLKFIAAPTTKFFKGDAKYADIIDVQLQDREIHTGSYEAALRHYAKLAHHENPDIKVVGQITSNRNHLDPDHSGNIGDGIHKAERDVVKNAPYVDGFWGYVYQQNHESVHAGTTILKDLADKKEKGTKI